MVHWNLIDSSLPIPYLPIHRSLILKTYNKSLISKANEPVEKQFNNLKL